MDLQAQAKELVAQMTLEEKASLCSGKDFWHLKGLERLGLPSVMVTDGPHGLRKQAGEGDHLGINQSVPATCFPAACATASSFDPALLRRMGAAIAEECQQEDVAVILGPGANIKRSPLCGRNFEYFSEDPYLTGELAAALIEGIETGGVGTSLKHYAANNQEKGRMTCDSCVDERALREIYLTGFEKAVKQGRPQTVMCSYNKVNGTYASENKLLLTDILRSEWGFEGLVMTDWGAANDRVKGIEAGLDLEMPASNGMNDASIVESVRNGTLDEAALDTCAARVVALILGYLQEHKAGVAYTIEQHHSLARQVAADSAVLLKNEGGLLPLAKTAKIAVLGTFAETPRYQGAGSSKINPHRVDSALDILAEKGVEFEYGEGYPQGKGEIRPALLQQARELARGKDAAIIFAGLPDEYESEGFDRADLAMPDSHIELIRAVAAVNPNTVVVLQCGAPVGTGWAKEIPALLLMYLGGEAVNAAAVDLLFGDAAPGGRLAETWPLTLNDTPCAAFYPGSARSAEYRESIFVGYRWYDTAGRAVAFPFGHGLGYTQFAVGSLQLDTERLPLGGTLGVKVDVENTGPRPGYEVVQVYVGKQTSAIMRAEKELKAFAKVYLQPGEKRTVELALDERAFAYYNAMAGRWAVEGGTYTVYAGASSRAIACAATVEAAGDGLEGQLSSLPTLAPAYFSLPGEGRLEVPQAQFAALYGMPLPPSEKPAGEPYSVNSTLGEIQQTWLGRQLNKIVRKQAGEILQGDEATQAMLEAMVTDIPLRSMVMMSGGMLTLAQLNGIVDMMNGKWVKGIVKLIQNRT